MTLSAWGRRHWGKLLFPFAVILAWSFFIAANVLFNLLWFDHLSGFKPVNVGDLQRLAQAGHGASRPGTDGNTPRLLDRLLVFNRTADAVLSNWGEQEIRSTDPKVIAELQKSGSKWINGESVQQTLDFLKAELDPNQESIAPTPVDALIPPNIEPLMLKHTFLAAELLRFRSWNPNNAGNDKDNKNHFDQLIKFPILQRKPEEAAKVVAEAMGWLRMQAALNPLPPPKPVAPATATTKSAEPSKDVLYPQFRGVWAVLKDEKAKSYRADLAKLVPLCESSELSGESTVPGDALSILYFPDSKGGSSGKSYCYALVISAHDSLGTGWSLEARYLLYELHNIKTEPIHTIGRGTVTVLKRAPWWWGFRPTAVVTSEDQLAERFWSELGKLRKGAGIGLNLSPTEEVVYVGFIRQLLLERLGKPTKDGSWESMDNWALIPRRLNGGSIWGIIQFLVVVAFFAFILEYIRINRRIRLTLRLLRPDGLNTPSVEWKEMSSAVKALSLRVGGSGASDRVLLLLDGETHTLRYLVSALPLIGFLGTVAGLSVSLIGSSAVSSPDQPTRQAALQTMQIALGTAFDKSMLAFLASIICLFGVSRLNRKLDEVSIDCLSTPQNTQLDSPRVR